MIDNLKSKTFLFILKILISFSLLFYLISKIGINIIINTIKQLNLLSFFVAVSIYIISIFLSSLRLRLFLSHKLPLRKIFSLYMIGSFFNTYMPGIVGGDAVKAYYLNKEIKTIFQPDRDAESSISESVASVFVDRYIGFFTLLCICLFAFPFGSKYLKNTSINWIIPLVFLSFILGSIVVFKFRIGDRLTFLANFYNYFQRYIKKVDVLIKSFLYSLIIQISGIFAVFVLSEGLSMEIPFSFFLLFIPIIILISFIPLSLSGIGLREGAFVVFFQKIGIPSHLSMTLSLLWFLSTVTASLLGLFEYLRYKQKNNA